MDLFLTSQVLHTGLESTLLSLLYFCPDLRSLLYFYPHLASLAYWHWKWPTNPRNSQQPFLAYWLWKVACQAYCIFVLTDQAWHTDLEVDLPSLLYFCPDRPSLAYWLDLPRRENLLGSARPASSFEDSVWFTISFSYWISRKKSKSFTKHVLKFHYSISDKLKRKIV